MQYLIDTHFHLDYYKNHSEIYKQINELQQYTICMTNSPGIFNSCIEMYSDSRYVKFALGFHPQMEELGEARFKEFQYLFDRSNYIGEVGLDFSKRYEMNREMQTTYFQKIIAMCSLKNKVVSVHLRNDNGEGLKIIEKYKPKKCIIHWFAGTYQELNKLINLNCYFSINENMIRNSKKNKWLLDIPIDKILIESDGPFTSVNGRKYTPNLLAQQYENISCFLNQPELISIVYRNFDKILK